MNNDQRIQAYFNKQLSPEERKAFEKALEQDKDFRESFEEYQAVHNAFKINDAERLKAKLVAHQKGAPSRNVFNIKPFFYAIAASVLMLLGASFYFNFFQQDPFNQYFDTYPNVYQPIVRGESDTASSTAFMYYENKMYKEAQSAFESLLKKENNPNIRFYYALSFLNDGNAQRATEEFEDLENMDFEFKPETYWYHALALIKLKKNEKAKALLQRLKAGQYSFNKDKIEPLLHALD